MSNAPMNYNLSPSVAECHDCGRKTNCTRITAESAEPGTGYRDEIDLCADCWEEREEQ
jgi:hypothetical protein